MNNSWITCDECSELFREGFAIENDHGYFCSSKCMVDFENALVDAGVIRRLQYGEEPELVYGH
jgi:hypothetical protein